MDLRERVLELTGNEAFDEILTSAIQSEMRNVWTAMPVSLSEDSDGKTTKLKFSIKAQQRDADGKTSYVEMPELDQVPIQFASGGNTTATFPLKKGDEGIVLFASRAIGAWREQGGVQQPLDTRSHSMSDPMFIPGIRSKPKDLKDINTDAAELRSDDGKHRSSLHPKDGMKMSVDNGRHQMAWHPDKGIAASVDNGAHTFGLDPKAGIAMKTAMKLAVDAAQGTAIKGPVDVDGKLKSTQSIGAPALQGVLSGFTGAALSVLIMAGLWTWTGASSPSEGIQQARYVLAAWSHP